MSFFFISKLFANLFKKIHDNFTCRIHGKWQISHFQNIKRKINFKLIDLDKEISEEIN
jgi:hypothetical protein